MYTVSKSFEFESALDAIIYRANQAKNAKELSEDDISILIKACFGLQRTAMDLYKDFAYEMKLVAESR